MSTKMTYNIVNQPFFPIIDKQGVTSELSLEDVFARAHELDLILGENPVITGALYRFLVAVTLRIVPDSATWRKVWKSGSFKHAGTTKYFDTSRERFDLFHP